MVKDESMREPANEQQSDTAASVSEEVVDTVKRTSAWGRAAGFLGKLAVNLLIGGLPFFAAGVFWLSNDDLSSQTQGWAPWDIVSVGAAIVIVVFVATLVSRPRLTLLSNEHILDWRHPSKVPPITRMFIGVLFLAAAGFMLWFTRLPYIFPFVPFVVGVWLYLRGVASYWINHHTAYYATNRRIVRRYLFLWSQTTGIPVDRVNSVEQKRSPFAMLTGRGNLQVISGISARQQVYMKDIDNPEPMERIVAEVTSSPSQ